MISEELNVTLINEVCDDGSDGGDKSNKTNDDCFQFKSFYLFFCALWVITVMLQ